MLISEEDRAVGGREVGGMGSLGSAKGQCIFSAVKGQRTNCCVSMGRKVYCCVLRDATSLHKVHPLKGRMNGPTPPLAQSPLPAKGGENCTQLGALTDQARL